MFFPSVRGLWIFFGLLPAILSQDCQKMLGLGNKQSLKLTFDSARFPSKCVFMQASLKTKRLNLYQLTEGLMDQEKFEVVCQTLFHTSQIYSMNPGSVPWAQDKVADFQQVLNLHECVGQPFVRINAAIRQYFKDLETFLKEKDYSACAWQVIGLRTTETLQRIPSILATICKKI